MLTKFQLKLLGEKYVNEEASLADQDFIIDMMDLSEEIMESDDAGRVREIKQEVFGSKEEHLNLASQGFEEENYESAFTNLAKMNVLTRKLELCEFQLDNLAED